MQRTNRSIGGADHSSTVMSKSFPIATVSRRKCGTSPFDKNWLNFDCCGLTCAVFAYLFHLYGIYVVCFVLIPPWMSYAKDGIRKRSTWGIFHTLAFISVAAIAIYSHYKTMTTDPGSVPPDAEPLPDDGNTNSIIGGDPEGKSLTSKSRACRRCRTFKPRRAHHCSICNRCIVKMDHHCPWVNNCVGIGNHKYFVLFIFYTFVSCTYSMSLLVFRFMECLDKDHHQSCLNHPADILHLVFLMAEAILFGMFTICMMFDQYDVITSGSTHIDRLKAIREGGSLESSISSVLASKAGEKGGTGYHEVFGAGRKGGNRWWWGSVATSIVCCGSKVRCDWLSPFAKVRFPESAKEEIMGFCRPCVIDCGTSSNDGKMHNGRERLHAGTIEIL